MHEEHGSAVAIMDGFERFQKGGREFPPMVEADPIVLELADEFRPFGKEQELFVERQGKEPSGGYVGSEVGILLALGLVQARPGVNFGGGHQRAAASRRTTTPAAFIPNAEVTNTTLPSICVR